MSATIDRLSVLQARQLLRDTSRLPEERVNEARRTVEQFYASRPPAHQRCVACGATGRWSEHSAGNDVVWACSICHAASSLTSDEWRAKRAEQDAEQQAAATAAEAAAANAPKPRAVLRERLAGLAAARKSLEQIERATPAARSRVWDLQAKVEAAEAAAAEANAGAAANLADALANGKSIGPASSAAKARAEHADAVDALSVAKSARILVEERLQAAKSQVDFAFDKCRKAARAVIASERLEDLITDAVEARANYLESVGALGWLVRNHAINGDDRRAHQILGDANVPPSAWPEAVAGAGAKPMEAAFDALMLDAAAVISADGHPRRSV